MKIVYLCHEYPPGRHGGIGVFTQTLGRALVARGHQVSIVGIYRIARRTEEDDQGVRVIRLPHSPIPKAGLVIDSARLWHELRHLDDAGAMGILEGPENAFATLPSKKLGLKIIRLHGGHHFYATELAQRPRLLRSWLERRSFSQADAICAVSQHVAEATRLLLHLSNRDIPILPNPVDTELFRPNLQMPEEDGLIVFVGTVCEKKGVKQLVQAMPRILDEVPGARLLVIGRDWRDPTTRASFTDSLRSHMSSLLRSRVSFLGQIENALLPTFLARAAVCVYPSHMEAQGITVVEGMAMGKAVVASQTGPGREMITDGTDGLVCDPYNPASIASSVVAFLTSNQLRVKLGANARETALKRFSVPVMAALNEAFYQTRLSA